MNLFESLLAIMGCVLLFFVSMVIIVVESLLKTLTGMVLESMAFVAIMLILALVRTDGEAVSVGGPSRVDSEARDLEWTVGGDGCLVGDAIETDAPRSVEEDNGRPITATGAVRSKPRCSPRIAAQTQTHVEPRQSPRLAANRKRAGSLRNVGLQPR